MSHKHHNLPYDLQSFITRTHRLIQFESNEEQNYDTQLKSKLTLYQLQQAGIILNNLYVSESYTGLYGRRLLVLCNKRGLATQLRSHTFTIRDIVSIVASNNITHTITNQNNIIISGTIYKVTDTAITVAIDKEQDTINVDSLPQSLCIIKQPNTITYDRYNNVLERLQQICSGTYKSDVQCQNILGVLYNNIQPTQSIEPYKWQPYSTTLNTAQIQAITTCLSSNDVHLIHGPPGTGKTTTVCELIYQYTQRQQRVLVCAPSNIAVDNVVEKLVNTYKIKCIRLGHPARLLPEILSSSLDSVVQRSEISQSCIDIRKDIKTQQNKLFKSNDKTEKYGIRGEIRQLQKELQQRERKAVTDEIIHSNVIACTLTGAASKQLQQYKYDVCIIDEAAQSLEIACLIPLIDCKRLVLAGDHKQLGPTIKSEQAARDGLEITLFDRLVQQYNDSIATLLNVQYRMHTNIMQWSSHEFYHDKLVADSSVATHLLTDMSYITNNDITTCPIMLIDTAGCNMYEIEKDTNSSDIKDIISDSKSNLNEADVVVKHIERLISYHIKPNDIAVIAPYNAQVSLLRDMLYERYSGIEIGTVDGLQGREKQCIVISLTRSNTMHEIGFLAESRRMNVAVTRAKRHVCVIGDSETVSGDKVLKGLVEYIESVGDVYSATEYMDESFQANAKQTSVEDAPVSTGTTSAINDILKSSKAPVKRKQRSKPQASKVTDTTAAPTQNNNNTSAQNTDNSIIDHTKPTEPELTETDIEQICKQLLQRIESGEHNASYKFTNSLDGNQRKLVHSIAERYTALSHDSVGIGRRRHIVLCAAVTPSPVVKQSNVVPPVDIVQPTVNTQQIPAKPTMSDAEKREARLKALAAMEKRSKATLPRLVDNKPTPAKFDILDIDDVKEDNKQTTHNKHITAVTTTAIQSVKSPINNTTTTGDNDADDIDAIMSELRVGQCHYAGCTTKLGITAMTCKYCNENYCTKHYSPVIHSDVCMKLYGQPARTNDLNTYKQSMNHNATNKHLTKNERSIMQAKLEAAKKSVAHKTAAKPKTKK